MILKKYKKVTVIVSAGQASEDIYYGSLGTLASGDYLLNLADGTLTTMVSVDFEAKYTLTSDAKPLTGTDWD